MASPLIFRGMIGGRENASTENGSEDLVYVVRSTQCCLILSSKSSNDNGWLLTESFLLYEIYKHRNLHMGKEVTPYISS